MIWRLFPFLLVAILVAGVLVSDLLACRSDHVSKGRLTGEDLKEKFQQNRERLGMMDEPGPLRFLSPEKARRMKKLNSGPFEERGSGIIYLKGAPKLNKVPPLANPNLP
jgi:hypothetical protein